MRIDVIGATRKKRAGVWRIKNKNRTTESGCNQCCNQFYARCSRKFDLNGYILNMMAPQQLNAICLVQTKPFQSLKQHETKCDCFDMVYPILSPFILINSQLAQNSREHPQHEHVHFGSFWGTFWYFFT